MNKTVEDGIREGGVRDPNMPIGYRDLSDNHGGAATIPVIQYFEQVSGLGVGKGVSEPVIENEQMGTGQRVQQLGIGAVGVGQFQRLQQSGSSLIADFAAGLAGSPTKRRG